MEHITDTSPLSRLRVHAPVVISRSQVQSLDEDVVFVPLTEFSPELVHCEAERQALERLLSGGPGAFYARLCEGHLSSFLSPQEVKQVSSWAEDYRSSEVHQEGGAGTEESSSATRPLSVQYFPLHSDAPAPDLELGWPEEPVWERTPHTAVYTNPPAEQMPHVREVVRRLLQGANTLIAIVTDRLTDIMVIKDLVCAASRGVPVYIILNRRSAQESFNTDALRHQVSHPPASQDCNIKLRVAGGKVFLSRDGRMVVGDLKENFILVDLKTLVLGSYSLTWTDAHLHRQLITVVRGPVLQAFDREFRILYAASLPVPDVWKPDITSSVPQLDGGQALGPSEHTEPDTHVPVCVPSPPSPPAPPTDSPIDWDTLGVTKWNLGSSESPEHLPELCGEPCVSYRADVDRQMVDSVEVGGRGTLGRRDGAKNVEKPETALHKHLIAGAQPEWEERKTMFRHRDLRIGKLREDLGLYSHTLRRHSLLRKDAGLGDNTVSQEVFPWRHSLLRKDAGLGDNTVSQEVFPWRHSPLRKDAGLGDDTLSQEAFPWRHSLLRKDAGLGDNTVSQEAFPWRHSLLRKDAGLGDNTVSQEAFPQSTKVAANHQKPPDDGLRTLSDILKRTGTRESSNSLKTNKTTLSKSMLDLRDQRDDPSQMAKPACADLMFPLTPAVALIKKRTDDIKAGLMRSPRTVIARSSSFGLQRAPWRPPSRALNEDR
ncbi:hypothetical protein P4O66_006098 [Electrophorus voltai]|uniref:Scaffolding anchor of CK1 domain-containing protein n=1 Tax=Electrophorus voltai TaxID=2609070 RepID=A0AAD9E0H8_9TELE|nr:hypothetical protein P4O66_006098 [Electrophorus voltai]